jgi:histone-lysine N-methyltransferase SETMAR
VTHIRGSFKNSPEFAGTILLHEGSFCKTVNKLIHIDILRRLSDAVRRKRHAKWRTDSWFPLHDNAPAHRSVLVKDIITKNNVATLEQSPYSPDLAPADLYLFPQLKSALKGQRLCDTTDIIKNATKELKRLSRNGFQKYFQRRYSRLQKCVVAHGDCTCLHCFEFLRSNENPGTF